MRKSFAVFGVFGLTFGAVVTVAGPSLAADTRVITTTPAVAWTSGGKSSKTDGTPLVIENLQVGDIIEVRVPPGATHGFITTKQHANVPPPQNDDKGFVWACGQTNKPEAAVLREIECGTTSNFGMNFVGTLKLEVLSTFKNDVNFWCTQHHFGMTGVLKLKP
jgi:hypothetical protein